MELERACLEGVPDVQEAAAVACPPPGGGPDRLFLFLVLRPGTATPPAAAVAAAELQQRCQQAISSRLNPLFRLLRVLLRSELPRNASNKVLRATLRQEVQGSQSKL